MINHRSSFFVALLVGFVLAGLVSCQLKNEIVLLNHGDSEYKIVVSVNSDTITEYAAREFQKYFKRSTGKELAILQDNEPSTNHEILIGATNRSPGIQSKLEQLNEDGFIIQTHKKKLLIAGGKEKGSLYGVYTFLEDYLGCRKYSHEVDLIPFHEHLSLGVIDIVQEPCFEFRELHMPISRWSADYRNWHKLDAKEGKNEWGMFVHTFDDFIPAQYYFKDHPEYFSFLNVKRVPDGQLCLSNPEVFQIVIDSLKVRMAEKPEALYWSVSQNDTYKPCECNECKEEYETYGGYSGAMIHFVNEVAVLFPDKVISTLAYQYTRAAPTHIIPSENVNIMFCSIECNRSQPLTTDPSSASFRKDTEDWCKLTDNIFMWDYVVQFRNLLSPFPNLRVLQPNIQYFRDNGMQMMFQQGSGGLMSEFVELRAYIIAKLLWNPDVDVQALMEDFCYGYYGEAAPLVLEYIQIMHDALESSGGDLGIYGYPYDGINTYLTPELLEKYSGIFDAAEKAVSDQPDYLNRLQIARLPLEFAIIDISLQNVTEKLSFFTKTDNNWEVREDMMERLELFTERAKSAGVARYWEHGNYPDDYKATVERYARSSMQNHLALNKSVSLKTPGSDKYPVGDAAALTNGLKGINDYHFNWLGFEGPDMEAVIDLGTKTTVSRVEMDFLQEIKSWVFLPEKIELYASNDGVDYKLIQSLETEIALNQEGTFIHTFDMEFPSTESQYMKIIAKNIGICPDWHPGATYPAWIFCDEVMVW